MSKVRDAFKDIDAQIKKTETEINKMYDYSRLELPIENDIILAKRNMAYNNIRMIVDKFKKEMKARERDE